MNPHIPEEYGGAGASFIDGVLIEEELGWGCSGIGTSISCNGLASAPVLLGGSEEIKKTYLGMLTEAPKLASFCLTEPGAGSDVSGMRTTAVKQRRQVRHQRLEDVHHQRRLRRLVHGLRQDRPGRRPPRHLGVRGPSRRRRRRRQARGQDGPAGVEHGDHQLQRRRDPGRRTCSARRTTASSWR